MVPALVSRYALEAARMSSDPPLLVNEPEVLLAGDPVQLSLVCAKALKAWDTAPPAAPGSVSHSCCSHLAQGGAGLPSCCAKAFVSGGGGRGGGAISAPAARRRFQRRAKPLRPVRSWRRGTPGRVPRRAASTSRAFSLRRF